MRRVICGLLLFFNAFPAHSEIIVKSGEHETFTRLVVYLPQDAKWTAKEAGATYRLDLEEYEEGFDIAGLFDVLPKGRLGTVEAKADHLIVSADCACIFREERLRSGYLVIDVVDADPQDIAGREGGAEIAQKPEPVSVPQLAALQTRLNDPVLPLIITKPSASQTFPKPADLVDRHARINDFRRSLLEQFGRASAQNLLTVPQIEIAPQPVTETTEASPEQFAQPDISPRTRLEVITAQDDAMPQIKALLDNSVMACHKPAYFDVSNWRGDLRFMEEQGAIRSRLYGEFDKISAIEALRLVRLYLHYGLAAEAHLTLDALQVESDAALAARQIAHILDGRQLSPDAPLATMLDCSGEVALWAVLGLGGGKISSASVERIVAEYSRLPTELRKFIGPRLASSLEAFDESVAAQVVRNALDRSVPQEQKGTDTVAPSVDVTTATDGELRAMLARNDESSPLALVQLLEGTLSNNKPINETDIELAASYAHQLRGGKVSATLRALELRSISRLGGFRTAFDRALEEVLPEARPKIIDAVIRDALTSGTPGDRSLIGAALVQEGVASDLKPDTAERLTDDLLAFGLPDLAREISAMRDAPLTASQQQAALLQDRAYAQALEALTTGDADPALRANLHLLEQTSDMMWRDGGAGIKDDALKRQAAWRAAAWEAITGDGATSTLARQIATPPVALEGAEPLTQSEQLLDKSTAARDAISQLLNRENQS